MKKSISVLEADLATLRAGRANPAVLNKISVEYYGAVTPLPQIGNISVPDPRTILIQPWDGSILGEVEKAILKSDLGITPTNDGKAIRLSFPPLTEERRKEIAKVIRTKCEDSKVAVRNIRRDVNEQLKKIEKNKEISEDDLKYYTDEVQKSTDKWIEKIDVICKDKEKQIMEI